MKSELLSNETVDSLEEAERQAKNWLDTQAALHDLDQIAGGFAKNVTGDITTFHIKYEYKILKNFPNFKIEP